VSLPKRPSIKVLGYLPDKELRSVMSGAVALLYPSSYEGFGLPPLEALACGVPAIVSDLPVLREATAGEAHFVPLAEPRAWVNAMELGLRGELRAGSAPPWTWDDAARALISALDPIL
jgi:glycosyltransferase involved in cell wall biosynthesis